MLPAWLTWSAVKGVAGKVPARVWLYLALLLALVGGVIWHQHVAHKAVTTAYQRGVNDEAAHVQAAALRIKKAADKVTTSISTNLRSKSDDQVRSIVSSAAALSVRGPAKALCTSGPSIPAATSGHQPTSGASHDSVPAMPDYSGPPLIAMPWDQATAYAQQCDLNRAEVISWREWWTQQNAAWNRLYPPVSSPSPDGTQSGSESQ